MQSVVPQEIQTTICDKLNCAPKSFAPASGGCINNGGKFTTTTGTYFLKWNSATAFPKMFQAEAQGLNRLSAASVVRIPKVFSYGEAGENQFLLIEFIDQARASGSYWKILAQQLAALHRISQELYGLDFDNFIGSLPQPNQHYAGWVDFFIDQRLRPQLALALKSGKISSEVEHDFDRLFDKLPDLLLEEKPALVHGDLWSGNVMTDEFGNPCLIDPAVYFGNREIEIAFTQLFGGFPREFYEEYYRVFPLQPSYESRFNLYNLYPLLVHVNLFGGGYFNQLVSILKRFV